MNKGKPLLAELKDESESAKPGFSMKLIVSFDEGFKYLGVTFVRSLIMTSFDKPKKERKVLYYPPPLNLDAYYLKKKRGW